MADSAPAFAGVTLLVKKKDLKVIGEHSLEAAFVTVLGYIRDSDFTTISHTTPESYIWNLNGDYRLVCRRAGPPHEIILGQHSGRGPKGGQYVAVNSGGKSEEINVTKLINSYE